MSFNFLNQGQNGDIQEVKPIDTFIDPVSKIRVSQPSNLIDTDFEYGLQPTKWETVELINNTPAFFSKGGDTTISDITGIVTNAGTREITVTTAFAHNLAVGIPIRVAGTKMDLISLTLPLRKILLLIFLGQINQIPFLYSTCTPQSLPVNFSRALKSALTTQREL